MQLFKIVVLTFIYYIYYILQIQRSFLYQSSCNMNILYCNEIVSQQYIQINKTKKEPFVQFDINKPYVFIMYDSDSHYLHWLIVNGKTIIPYIGPDTGLYTSQNNEIHRYVFSLFSGNITRSILQNNSRINFNFDNFTNELQLITQNYFTTHS